MSCSLLSTPPGGRPIESGGSRKSEERTLFDYIRKRAAVCQEDIGFLYGSNGTEQNADLPAVPEAVFGFVFSAEFGYSSVILAPAGRIDA